MSTPQGTPASSKPGPLSAAATVLATGFGSGYAPVAPGTAGTAVGLALYWPLQLLTPPMQLLATAVLFVLGCAVATHVARSLGRKDPGVVVVDEIVGMWASLLFLPLNPQTALLGFLLFRLFDVVKPFPARQFEALPEGLGIMADDLMAGIYVNLVLRIISGVVPLA
jgi:phosphatidylglycerophosphatase A